MNGPAEFLKDAWPKLAKEYGDPLAPLHFQNAYAGVDQLGRVVCSSPINQAKVVELMTTMVDAVSNVCQPTDKEYLAALACMTSEAMVSHLIKLVKGEATPWESGPATKC